MRPADAIQQARKVPPEEAVEILHDAWVEVEVGGEAPLDAANLLLHLADRLAGLRRWPEAVQRIEQAVARYQEEVGLEDARTHYAREQLARALEGSGQPAAALALVEALHPRAEGGLGALVGLWKERLLGALGETQRAEQALLEALGCLMRPELDALTDGDTVLGVAERLRARDRLAQARDLVRHALESLDEILAGRRVSFSARAPGQVRERLARRLAELMAGGPPG
jgi:tetratricopeptide (TPR) repeat protein